MTITYLDTNRSVGTPVSFDYYEIVRKEYVVADDIILIILSDGTKCKIDAQIAYNFSQNNSPYIGEIIHGVSGQSTQANPGNSPVPLAGGTTYVVTATTPPVYPSTAAVPSGIGQQYQQYVAQQQLQQQLQQQVVYQTLAGASSGIGTYVVTPSGLSQLNQPPSPKSVSYPVLKTEKIQLGEIVGWRGWMVMSGGFLKSVAMDTIWAPREPMEGKPKGHDGPGIYAFRHLRQFLKDFSHSTLVYGRIAMWGDVIEHDLGWRSEWAKIISLDGLTMPSSFDKGMLDGLRRTYGVEA